LVTIIEERETLLVDESLKDETKKEPGITLTKTYKVSNVDDRKESLLNRDEGDERQKELMSYLSDGKSLASSP